MFGHSLITTIGYVVILVIVSIASINAHLRFVSTIFPEEAMYKNIFRRSMRMGGIVAGILMLFHYTIEARAIDTLHMPGSVIYGIYIVIAMCLLLLGKSSRIKHRKRRTFLAGVSLISLATSTHLFLFSGGAIGLLILKAMGEEILKFTNAQTNINTQKSISGVSGKNIRHNPQSKHTIVIMSIVAGLSFALFENIIYAVTANNIGLFIGRTMITPLMHGLFTGVIGFILQRKRDNGYRGYLIAYASGILLHALYNIGISTFPSLTTIVAIVTGYGLLSYLLYHADALYER